jgi:hypothetical protein
MRPASIFDRSRIALMSRCWELAKIFSSSHCFGGNASLARRMAGEADDGVQGCASSWLMLARMALRSASPAWHGHARAEVEPRALSSVMSL